MKQDLKRDGEQNHLDNLPVSESKFNNQQSYVTKLLSPASVWPNNMADPGVPPPAWHALVPTDPCYPSFIEVGCYVVDTGSPVYTVQAFDDPAQPNPGSGGTLTGTTGNYQMDFYYVIRNGVGPYFIDFDFDYTGAWNDGAIGRTTNAGTNTAFSYSSKAGSGAQSDLNVPVPAAMPNGNYTMAVRVIDSNTPADTAIFTWTGVTLQPPFKVVVIDDLLDDVAAQGGNNATANVVADLTFLYGAGAVSTMPAPAAGAAFSPAQLTSLNEANGIMWLSDGSFNTSGYTGPLPSGNFSLQAGDPKAATLTSLVTGGKVLFIGGGGGMRLEINNIWASGTFLPWTNTAAWFFDGTNATPNYFFGTSGNIPNNLSDGSLSPGVNTRGFNTGRVGLVGIVGCEQNMSGAPVGVARGWIGTSNTYTCLGYRNVGTGSVIQIALNYGDLAGTQMTFARHLWLENILCRGNAASPFNSPNT
jgi:hypothetical protein